MTISPYHVLTFIHLISLIIGFGAVLVIDTSGLLWILKKRSLSFVQSVAEVTQPLIWIGWSGLVLSGSALLIMKGSVSGLTAIKLFFVALLGLNGLYLHITKQSFPTSPDTISIPSILKFRITIASTLSQIGWWGAIIIGFLNTKVKTNIPVIDNPLLFIVPFGIIVLITIITGEFIFRNKQSQ